MSFARAVQLHQLIRQGAWMLMLLVLARAGLQLEEIGNFESLRYLGFVLTVPLLTSIGLAFLRVRQVTLHEQRWFVYFTLIMLIGGLITFGIFIGGGNYLATALLGIDQLDFLFPYGVFLLGSFIGTLIEQEAIADQDARRLLGFSVSSYGVQVLGFSLPLILGLPILVAMWGLAFSTLFRIAWLLVRYVHNHAHVLPLALERKLFWSQTTQLGTYGTFGLLVMVIDHFLVGHFSSQPEQAVALWRYGAQELPLVVGVVAGLNATALVERQGGEAVMISGLLRRSRTVTIPLLALACVLMLVSPWLYKYLLGDDLYSAHVIFSTLLLVLPCRLIQTQPLLISADLQRYMLRVGFGESLLNIAISASLFHLYGLLGVAIGTVIAYNFERFAYVYILHKHGHPLSSYAPIAPLVGFSALLFVLYFLVTDFSALLPG